MHAILLLIFTVLQSSVQENNVREISLGKLIDDYLAKENVRRDEFLNKVNTEIMRYIYELEDESKGKEKRLNEGSTEANVVDKVLTEVPYLRESKEISSVNKMQSGIDGKSNIRSSIPTGTLIFRGKKETKTNNEYSSEQIAPGSLLFRGKKESVVKGNPRNETEISRGEKTEISRGERLQQTERNFLMKIKEYIEKLLNSSDENM